MMKPHQVLLTALTALGILITSTAAMAAPAKSTVALNVRSGPGTSYGVVDTLFKGEPVEVTECVSNGWCHVKHAGPNGWVSSKYLVATGGGSGGSGGSSGSSGSDPDCSFGLSLGSDGPNFSINCGDTTPAPTPPKPTPPTPTPPTPSPDEDLACVYTGINFTGNEFCHGPATYNSLSGSFNDKISSVELFGNAKIKLCRNTNLGGTCRTYTSDNANLPSIIDNRASSMKIYVGSDGPVITPVPVPATPVTYSTGPINLQQTFAADLDSGNVGSPGADIWYQAETAIQKFITPRNGAKLALGNKSNRGYAGCAAESFSTNRISIWQMPVGSYVCVKTNQGRISQFRLNGYAGTTMKLGYTTWAN